ncbi:BTB/POZ domain-containing protein [Aspergillus homomorphus CBS 101889]|uniref:BTB domain-containing protein n=1 Tax=Aspergillus homomorphus (strain CBS 101889) TaxID=1450537 RepID=A0A395I990_ASPHC|nr:hypothetical protein BO97DRAFT_381814 [Aspergillus homomorphus CBS 101889]RAL16792.1 hypothetical protein BO97DRAFT_381814 [Aspergillus homomorphus CBS 101889]
MDQAIHIIDPDGEVIIVLQNPNAPFAELTDGRTRDSLAYTPSGPSDEIQNSEESIKASRKEPIGTLKKKKKKKKVKEIGLKPKCRIVPNTSESFHLVSEKLEQTCFRVQVSAKHLILASSVFEKILTGGWKESITYLRKGSVEITADSWDADALLIMLRIIHCQSHQVPRKLTLEMLAKVAVLADYYDCREALLFFTDTWITALDEIIPATYSRDLILWLWVTWYFRLPAKFKEVTSKAMSLSNGWIDNLGLPIPVAILRSMNDKRQGAIAGLIARLDETRDGLQDGSKGCGFECSSIMYGALTKEMYLNNLLSLRPVAPFPDLSYRSLVQKVSSFRSPAWYSHKSYNPSYRHDCVDSTFELLIGVLEDTIEGLDLKDSVTV